MSYMCNCIPMSLASSAQVLHSSTFFQAFSPLKLLGLFDSQFQMGILRVGEQKFVKMVLVKMAAKPINAKTPLKIFSRAQRPMTWGLDK